MGKSCTEKSFKHQKIFINFSQKKKLGLKKMFLFEFFFFYLFLLSVGLKGGRAKHPLMSIFGILYL